MPMAATLEKYAEFGYTGPNMPSGTLLTACTPGAFDALMVCHMSVKGSECQAANLVHSDACPRPTTGAARDARHDAPA